MVSLKVTGIPKNNDTNTWSDYLELLTLVNMDSACSHAFALDRIIDSPEDVVINDIVQGNITNEDEEGEDEGSALSASSQPIDRKKAKYSRMLDDALSLCTWRLTSYGDSYPFEVDMVSKQITLKNTLSDSNYSYLFLLICGNLPFVNKHNGLTNAFEVYCLSVFSRLLPAGSEAHCFGKATATAKFSGNKFEKLTLLANAVHGAINVTEADFRAGDYGDAGIDLVGWMPLKDESPRIPVSLAQCACSREEWVKKQAEIMPDFLRHLISIIPEWTPYVFIPICFRQIGGSWAVKSEVKSVVLLDRLRIINNCPDHGAVTALTHAKQIVDAVNQSEEIV